MVWLRARALWWAVVLVSVGIINGCGGHKPPGTSHFPARVILTPSGNTSLQLGSVFAFAASAQNSSGGTVSTTFTWTSSDTSILNLAPNGVACAGRWDAAYANCTPGGVGLVTVTASALGASSTPTLVFVHPPIDNITVTGVLLNNIPIQEPCLSQGQTMTVEAHAFSQGSDVTESVGPFTWSANNASVVKLTPIIAQVVYNNFTYYLATNQATAEAATPGITQIFATANGVTSTSFQQPPPGTNLNFFETCPIQNITLELDHAGSQQTSFAVSKGTPETVIATVTDVMGNNSLPNTDGSVALSNIPLTWTASQPADIAVGTVCTLSCAVSTAAPGAGSVTASCAPPTCNIGFPEAPPGAIAPLPVYATTAISGLVTGATSPISALATSLGCAASPPDACTTSSYNVSTSRGTAGAAIPMPVSPNSLLFDLAGDKAYMGSDFGAQVVNPANFGGSTSAFTALGTVTGKILAISTNGSVAIFSDTLHIPNQVYVVNTAGPSLTTTALSIPGATAAAFSPDGLKAFIFGDSGASFYIYSTQQALQPPIALSGSAISAGFSPNDAFAYVAEAAANGNPANLTAFSVCNDQVAAASIALPANPIQMRVLPGPHIEGGDSEGRPIPDGVHVLLLDATGFDIVTSSITVPPLGTLQNPGVLCPQTLSFVSVSTPPASPVYVQRVELGQGNINPINFFVSADGTLLYVVASDRNSILIYNFATASPAGGISLASTPGTPNPTPISADMSADAGTIVVAGSDGYLHQLSAGLGGSDQAQIPFPNLPNFFNPFCTFTPAQGACTLDFVAARP
jgi:hypothetical protein